MRAVVRSFAAGVVVLGGLVAVGAPPAAARTPSCPPALRATFARGTGATGVTVHQVRVSGLATCRYRAHHVRTGGCGGATVQVDTGPQVFRDFQRWVDETGQTAAQSSIRRPGQAPVEVDGVGLEADWVPAKLLFETATRKRWVTVTLNCRVAPNRGLPLARHLAAVALR